MDIKTQRRLAASLLKCGETRVWFDNSRLEEIKEAITKEDIRGLIADGAIAKRKTTGISRFRARKIALQKRKKNRKGVGSRKGKRTARLPKKQKWMNAIRVQRDLLKRMRDHEILTRSDYHMLYLKAKGGFFRSERHLKLYIEEHNLAKKK